MNHEGKTYQQGNLEHAKDFIDGYQRPDESHFQTAAYKETLNEATSSMYVRLKNTFEDSDERQEAIDDFEFALNAYMDVYMAIGMKIGARVIMELLLTDENAMLPEIKSKLQSEV